jgi:predicted acetyltransferase
MLLTSARERRRRSTPAGPAQPVSLAEPTPEGLDAYERALAAGWSPDSERDASLERLKALRRDREGFFREITGREPTPALDDGRVVPRLPMRAFWIWDGAFAGTINLRFQPGTEDLPDHVSGHVGYTVVPWRRGRGYATRALALLLPVARAHGLPRVLLTCDPENAASRRVIEANGGVLAGVGPHPWAPGRVKLHFWVGTGAAGP